MKLKYPNSSLDFKPSLGWFLGAFDVYDREETLGEKLDRVDPLDPVQLQQLFDQFVFAHIDEAHGYTAEHKAEIVKCLVAALRKETYDFSAHLPDYEDGANDFFLPSSWAFPRPRYVFEQAYLATVRHWLLELEDVGFVFPSINELGISEYG